MTQRQDARVRQPTKLRLGRRCYSDRRNTGLLRRNDVHDDRRCQRSEPTRNVKAYTPDRDDALAHPRATCHLNRLVDPEEYWNLVILPQESHIRKMLFVY